MASDEQPKQPDFFMPPTFPWREPNTGRKGWRPSFELQAFGMYVKRARYIANVTQTRLEGCPASTKDRSHGWREGLRPGRGRSTWS